MPHPADSDYYTIRKSDLLQAYDEDANRWKPILISRYGGEFAKTIIIEGRGEFEGLIPQIPYIGGDASYTGSLVESARCLCLYRVMKKNGKTAEETGKILYEAILARIGEPQTPTPSLQTPTVEQLMERRKDRAVRSQERSYALDYVFEFVSGDGQDFDYGYDFTECAAQKFYHIQGADEFLQYYCFLDFPHSKVFGLGLSRTTTLAEEDERCNFRYKSSRSSELEWPPPFLKK